MSARVAASIAALVLLAAAAGCGSSGRDPDRAGSTLHTTWRDTDGDGALEPRPGEPLARRTELAPAARLRAEVARLGVLSDVHLADEESPAHLPFLDRLGPPFSSTFRPQEALQPRVLAAAVRSLNAARPQAVLEAGDLADSAQSNELRQARRVLDGGLVRPDSGERGYHGPQLRSNPDPLFYRPDVDAPRYAGLLDAAERPFRSPGLRAPWHPVLGNHEILVAGELAPTQRTNALATGDRALTRLDPSFSVPRGEEALAPEAVDQVLAAGLPGDTERRAPDPDRRQLSAAEAVERLRPGTAGPRLEYAFDIGRGLRVIVLDVVARDRGAGGRVSAGTLRFLRAELARAGDRRIAVATHQPLRSSAGGERVLALLDRDRRVVATLAGHTHRNRIRPRRTAIGGYWQIETASLADYPQQARMLALVRTEGGGLALRTWMVDPAPGDRWVDAARRLAYLDVQGGRPSRAAARAGDRNALLYLPR